MTLLEMREAVFFRGGETLAGPVDATVHDGEYVARVFRTAREAAIVALMAAGLAKARSGRVFVGEFDPRIQPVQVKRLVGYVPHEAVPHEFPSFASYIHYRAALWGIERSVALARAQTLLARLDGVHEAFAYPLIGALLAAPRLLVLDRPQAAYAAPIVGVASGAALFSTHVSAREAQRFTQACDERAQEPVAP